MCIFHTVRLHHGCYPKYVVNQFRFWFSHLHLLHLQREVEIQKEDKERALYSDELELAKLSEEISFQWEITAR